MQFDSKLSFLLLIFFYCIEISLQQIIECPEGTLYNELRDTCDNCSNGCKSCTGYHEKDCLECKRSATKIDVDNQFYCITCPLGQYFDETSATCMNCSRGCSCLICDQGYVIDSIYLKCDTIKCMTGYFRNPLTDLCEICPQYDLECIAIPETKNLNLIKVVIIKKQIKKKDYDSDTNEIIDFYTESKICKQNYQLSTNYCTCTLGFYMKNGVCQSCLDVNCNYCNSKGICNTCKNGYFLQEGECVVRCDEFNYYINSYLYNPFIYNCQSYSKQQSTTYKIITTKSPYQCNQYSGYTPNEGCFIGTCKPHEFLVYNIDFNSYTCSKYCDEDSTVNYEKMTCIRNSCEKDITQKIGNTCYYRTCELGRFFQPFSSVDKKPVCQQNYSFCYDQTDESSICKNCIPGYLKSYSGSICVEECKNDYYYISKNKCSSCDYTYSTPKEKIDCVSKQKKVSFIALSKKVMEGLSCPEGYDDSVSGQCTRCSEPTQILCTTQKTQYVCEWGENNTNITCDKYVLTTLTGKAFDSEGSLVDFKGCITFNSDGSCKICPSPYNYNFFGVCSQSFSRQTKYYVYYSKTEKQYIVKDSCSETQYVQMRSNMRECKDFAYCEQKGTTQDGLEIKTICQKCPSPFYNLNGNCIEDCPIYTFKNQQTLICETPIDNCSIYDQNKTLPFCSKCLQGFLLYNKNSQCIQFIDCKIGFYINVGSVSCLPCTKGCKACDSAKRCLQASDQYYLLDDSAIKACPKGYYRSESDRTCKVCIQFCAECIDDKTCTVWQNSGIYNYLLNDKIYYYLYPICLINQYFDQISKKCYACDKVCAQCITNSSYCLLCQDPLLILHNNQCITKCPIGYYKFQLVTKNYSRFICKQCDVSCLNSDCHEESTLCSNGCSTGYSAYQGRCLEQCLQGYNSRNSVCYKTCNQGQYNIDFETFKQCKDECLECTDGQSCTKCKLPLIYQNGTCVQSCVAPYFQNPLTNQCVNCGSKRCVECKIKNNQGECTKCLEGFEVYESNKCVQISIYDDDNKGGKQKSDEENDESKYPNQPITYQGKIYSGEDCHYSCKQCKGNGFDECLSCNLSTRVFFEQKYCICADGYAEVGDQKQCKKQDNLFPDILSIVDIAFNCLILISVAFNRIPLLSLQLIDIIQNGSYQIYLENIYNFQGKLPIMQVIYSSNLSNMIPNQFYDQFGVYKQKQIKNGNEELIANDELDLIYNNISNLYIFNSIPYIAILSFSFFALIYLKYKKNQQRYEIIINKFLVIFYYLTFQDQVLFIGLQFKYLQSALNYKISSIGMISLITLIIAVIFNIFIIIRALQLQISSLTLPISSIQSFEKLFINNQYFIGLLPKLMNSLSILLQLDMKVYIFGGVIIFTLLLNILISIQRYRKNFSSKLFLVPQILISLESVIFLIPVLLSMQNNTNNDLNEIQITLNKALIFQKLGILFIEMNFLVLQHFKYNTKAGLFQEGKQPRSENTQPLNQQEMTTIAIQLEEILKTQNVNWKKQI